MVFVDVGIMPTDPRLEEVVEVGALVINIGIVDEPTEDSIDIEDSDKEVKDIASFEVALAMDVLVIEVLVIKVLIVEILVVELLRMEVLAIEMLRTGVLLTSEPLTVLTDVVTCPKSSVVLADEGAMGTIFSVITVPEFDVVPGAKTPALLLTKVIVFVIVLEVKTISVVPILMLLPLLGRTRPLLPLVGP